jgi:cytochrome P450
VHKIFDQYIDTAIERHRAEANENEVNLKGDSSSEFRRTEKQQSLISMLHSLMELTQDRAFIRDQLLNVFLGAKDTATIGISDIFFHLARHPEVWRKLRDEVTMSIVPGESLNLDTLKAFPYLQNILKESLRLLSSVDMINRVCVQDTILLRGGGPNGDAPLLVHKGTRVEGRLAPMHRDKSFWGEDAEDFIPERWERWERGEGKRDRNNVEDVVAQSDSGPDNSPPPRWEYVPFLGGGRMCPARQMTLT